MRHWGRVGTAIQSYALHGYLSHLVESGGNGNTLISSTGYHESFGRNSLNSDLRDGSI